MLRDICPICDRPVKRNKSGACPVELGYQRCHFNCWFSDDKKIKRLRQKAINKFKKNNV